MGIKVKANAVGFYLDTLRQIGEVFELRDGDKVTTSWQEVVEDKAAEKPVKKDKQ